MGGAHQVVELGEDQLASLLEAEEPEIVEAVLDVRQDLLWHHLPWSALVECQ